MTVSYFLTGSYKDEDNDFELIIDISKSVSHNRQNTLDAPYKVYLEDLTSDDHLIKEITKASFEECLTEISGFISDNGIRFYGKNLTAPTLHAEIDRQLQQFIYKSSPENL